MLTSIRCLAGVSVGVDCENEDHFAWSATDGNTLTEGRFRYMGRLLTREQLRAEVEAEAAGLPAEQWMFGRFEFNEWLSDSIITGHITRVDNDGAEA